VFVEDVVLCALRGQNSWNVSEHLLRHENTNLEPAELAQRIADRNELRVAPVMWQERKLYRFTRME
jgi:hypothetical protein